jgi:DNA polymerase-4
MNASRSILHVDMDAFYASVEQRDHPEYRGRPVIVGSSPDQRGVVCAASYEARRFGVRSAMPSRTAWRLCPDGVFVRPRMDAYREESLRIFQRIRETGVEVEQVSVDEAYLEATRLFGSASADPDTALEAALPFARNSRSASARNAGSPPASGSPPTSYSPSSEAISRSPTG